MSDSDRRFSLYSPDATLYSSGSKDLRPRPAFLSGSLNASMSRSTLLWINLELWMDEEYLKQVCILMGWDYTSILFPQPAGQQANDLGYCYIIFPTPAYAASVLVQTSGTPVTMPNSTKPFVLTWAPAMSSSLTDPQQYQQEFSVFVGDLSPEATSLDLVAVFLNPQLGLPEDREPKYIRPFRSCKSAKVMIDQLTGMSRCFAFVRFIDQCDQQRALIEMQGICCKGRPMRLCPATAKSKPPSYIPTADSISSLRSNSVQGSSSNNSMGGSSSGGSLSSNATSAFPLGFPNNDTNNVRLSEVQLRQAGQTSGGYFLNEESRKHHAQARAIPGNLIGPNGELLTSNDSYITTLFIGGLSPSISEETLWTLFLPFGYIHYVKVLSGKNCGFVQYARKADAEQAIVKMQDFPIDGCRLRLSWGRSSHKAAQSVAQTAQAAASQAQCTAPNIDAMTPQQAFQLLRKLFQLVNTSHGPGGDNANVNGDIFSTSLGSDGTKVRSGPDTPQNVDAVSSIDLLPRHDVQRSSSSFLPFSPDSNSTFAEDSSKTLREPVAAAFARSQASLHSYAPSVRSQTQDLKPVHGAPPTTFAAAGKLSPSARASRYDPHFDMMSGTVNQPDPTSRPSPVTQRDHAKADHHYDLEDLNRTLRSLDLNRNRQLREVNNSGNGNGTGNVLARRPSLIITSPRLPNE